MDSWKMEWEPWGNGRWLAAPIAWCPRFKIGRVRWGPGLWQRHMTFHRHDLIAIRHARDDGTLRSVSQRSQGGYGPVTMSSFTCGFPVRLGGWRSAA